jgi:predicted Zn-ribbon and HTH transcriptional regulator
MICPKCHSPKVHKSRSANAELLFPVRLFMVWARCHYCGAKFRLFGLFPGSRIPDAAGERQAAA